MIAVITAPQKMWINWFDVAVISIVAFGFWRGRKNGMTKELLPVSLWLTIVIAAGLGNQMLGDMLRQQGIIRSVFGKAINEKTAAYLSAYLLITVLALIVFSFIKRGVKPKLEGSNFFGGSEYYFGMVSGMIRYACILIFGLALLNAPYYSVADILAAKAYSNRWFGGGMAGYSGDFFPTVSELRVSIFKESLAGPFIHSNFSELLVNSGPPGGPVPKPAVVTIER